MKYEKPKPGETIYCWEGGKNYIPHKHMLYLGPDQKFKDNLLVHSEKYGWDIISLSELPEGNYRSLGKLNIESEAKNGKEYVYRFCHNTIENIITVKVLKGLWRVKKDFELPKWVKKEK